MCCFFRTAVTSFLCKITFTQQPCRCGGAGPERAGAPVSEQKPYQFQWNMEDLAGRWSGSGWGVGRGCSVCDRWLWQRRSLTWGQFCVELCVVCQASKWLSSGRGTGAGVGGLGGVVSFSPSPHINRPVSDRSQVLTAVIVFPYFHPLFFFLCPPLLKHYPLEWVVPVHARVCRLKTPPRPPSHAGKRWFPVREKKSRVLMPVAMETLTLTIRCLSFTGSSSQLCFFSFCALLLWSKCFLPCAVTRTHLSVI